jgi:arylsulfatase A-like enzyme
MEEMDAGIEQILDTVEKAGIAERTLVFFFSDNGAARKGPGSNAPFRGGKGNEFEGGHRMPALAWWPGTIAPGTETDQLSISLDLMPTMLELADTAVPDGHTLDGVSLGTLLTEGQPLDQRQLSWNGKAMRDGNWKLLERSEGSELYDLAQDIGEETNVASEHPERVTAMRAALEVWRKDVGASGAT